MEVDQLGRSASRLIDGVPNWTPEFPDYKGGLRVFGDYLREILRPNSLVFPLCDKIRRSGFTISVNTSQISAVAEAQVIQQLIEKKVISHQSYQISPETIQATRIIWPLINKRPLTFIAFRATDDDVLRAVDAAMSKGLKIASIGIGTLHLSDVRGIRGINPAISLYANRVLDRQGQMIFGASSAL